MASARFAEASGIATDSAGNTLAAWSLMPEEGERLLARWVSPSGALGPQIDLSPGSRGYGPQVAMAPSGRAFVAWRFFESNESTVMGRWVEHDGTLGPLLTLATPDPGKLDPVEPDVAVDLAGVATVSWRNDAGGNPEIRLRRISPASDVGPVSDKIGSGGATQIADLPSGTTVIAWRGTGTELNTVSADGTVGTAETISSTNATAEPELGVDQHGNGLVVWRDDDMAPPFTLRGARFDPTGSPVGGEITIDGEAEYLGTRSAIAADTAGNFLVAWVRYVPNKESVTYIRGIDPSGEFRGPPQPISAAGSHAEDGLAAAIDDQGRGAVAWLDYDLKQSRVVGRPIQSVGLPDGDLTELIPAPVEISVIAAGVPALGYAAFLARQRDAVVLRRFLEPPVCRDSEATVTQGRPVTISALLHRRRNRDDAGRLQSGSRHGRAARQPAASPSPTPRHPGSRAPTASPTPSATTVAPRTPPWSRSKSERTPSNRASSGSGSSAANTTNSSSGSRSAGGSRSRSMPSAAAPNRANASSSAG